VVGTKLWSAYLASRTISTFKTSLKAYLSLSQKILSLLTFMLTNQGHTEPLHKIGLNKVTVTTVIITSQRERERETEKERDAARLR